VSIIDREIDNVGNSVREDNISVSLQRCVCDSVCVEGSGAWHDEEGQENGEEGKVKKSCDEEMRWTERRKAGAGMP
jgi:hypothetical protein